MSISAVKGALRCNEDEVLELIDDGKLSWAFNIATRGAQRVEIRVLSDCVQEWDLGKDQGTTDQGTKGLLKEKPFAEIFKLIFPNLTKPFVSGKDVQLAFNCVSDHVLNLIREGSLEVLKGTDWQRGPGGSPCVTVQSLQTFLRARRRA